MWDLVERGLAGVDGLRVSGEEWEAGALGVLGGEDGAGGLVPGHAQLVLAHQVQPLRPPIGEPLLLRRCSPSLFPSGRTGEGRGDWGPGMRPPIQVESAMSTTIPTRAAPPSTSAQTLPCLLSRPFQLPPLTSEASTPSSASAPPLRPISRLSIVHQLLWSNLLCPLASLRPELTRIDSLSMRLSPFLVCPLLFPITASCFIWHCLDFFSSNCMSDGEIYLISECEKERKI